MIDPAISQPTTANPFAQPTLADNFAKAGGTQAGSPLQAQQAARDAEVLKSKEEFTAFRTKLAGKPVEQQIKDQVLFIAAHVQRDASYPVTDVVVPAAWTGAQNRPYKADQKLNWRDAAVELTGKPKGSVSDQTAASSLLVYLPRDLHVAKESAETAKVQGKKSAFESIQRIAEYLTSQPDFTGRITNHVVVLEKDFIYRPSYSQTDLVFKKGDRESVRTLLEKFGYDDDGGLRVGSNAEVNQKVLAIVNKELQAMAENSPRVQLQSEAQSVKAFEVANLPSDPKEKQKEILLSQGSAASQVIRSAKTIKEAGINYSQWNVITLDRDLVVNNNVLYKKGDQLSYKDVAMACGMNELEIKLGTDKLSGRDVYRQEAANIERFFDQSKELKTALAFFEGDTKSEISKEQARVVELAMPYEQLKSAIQAIAQDGKNWDARRMITLQADFVVGDNVCYKKGQSVDWTEMAGKLGLSVVGTGSGPEKEQGIAQNLLRYIELKGGDFYPKQVNDFIHKYARSSDNIYDRIELGLGGGAMLRGGTWEVKAGQALEQQKVISTGYETSKNTLAKSKALAQIKAEMKLEGGEKEKTGKINDAEITLQEGFVDWKGEAFKAGDKVKISTLFWHLSGGSSWPAALPGEERASTLARYNGLLDSQSSVLSSEYSLNNQKLQTAVTNFQTWTSVMQGILSALSNMSKEIAQGMK